MFAKVHVETALSSEEVLTRYNLVSSATVTRSRTFLFEKDILDIFAGKISLQDPMYRYWLKNAYFASLNSPHTAGLS